MSWLDENAFKLNLLGRMPAQADEAKNAMVEDEIKRQLERKVLYGVTDGTPSAQAPKKTKETTVSREQLRPPSETVEVYGARAPYIMDSVAPLKSLLNRGAQADLEAEQIKDVFRESGDNPLSGLDVSPLYTMASQFGGVAPANYKKPVSEYEKLQALISDLDKKGATLDVESTKLLSDLLKQESTGKEIISAAQYAPTGTGGGGGGVKATEKDLTEAEKRTDQRIEKYEKQLDRDGFGSLHSSLSRLKEKVPKIFDEKTPTDKIKLPGVGRDRWLNPGKIYNEVLVPNKKSEEVVAAVENIIGTMAREMIGMSQTKTELARFQKQYGSNINNSDAAVVNGLRGVLKALYSDIKKIESSQPEAAKYYKTISPDFTSSSSLFDGIRPGSSKKKNPFRE